MAANLERSFAAADTIPASAGARNRREHPANKRGRDLPRRAPFIEPAERAVWRSLVAVLLDLVDADPHVPRLAAVGRTEDAGLLELIHDPRRPAIADAELPLQQRGRAALVLDAGNRGFLELRIPLARLGCPLTALPGFPVGHLV